MTDSTLSPLSGTPAAYSASTQAEAKSAMTQKPTDRTTAQDSVTISAAGRQTAANAPSETDSSRENYGPHA